MGELRQTNLKRGKKYSVVVFSGEVVSAEYLGKGIFAVSNKERRYIFTGGEGLVDEIDGVIIPSLHSSFLHYAQTIEDISKENSERGKSRIIKILRELGEKI